MAEDNPRPEKRQHPLLQSRPAQPAPKTDAAERQQTTLFIRTVEPRVTYVLIAINVVVFVIRAFSPQLDIDFILRGANNPVAVIEQTEYWRLLTSMFLHASIFNPDGSYGLQNSMHIIFNMYALYIIGRPQEGFFGHRRFLLIYLMGGLGGSVLSASLGADNTFSVGASGAVFAIIGAEAVFLYQHRKLFGARGRSRLQSLVIQAIIILFIGGATAVADTPVRIDNLGHLGGLVGGAALAWYIAPFFILKPDPQRPGAFTAQDTNPLRRRRWMISAYAATLFVVLFIAGLAAHPGLIGGGNG